MADRLVEDGITYMSGGGVLFMLAPSVSESRADDVGKNKARGTSASA
jgi:hypothetical protein